MRLFFAYSDNPIDSENLKSDKNCAVCKGLKRDDAQVKCTLHSYACKVLALMKRATVQIAAQITILYHIYD